MKIQTKIICKNFKHKKIMDKKLIVDSPSGEYYLIPVTKQYNLKSDDEVYELTFNKQLLWLKYSNRFKEILIKDYDFTDYLIIKSEDMLDVYVKIECNSYLRKNTWHGNIISLSKEYIGKYLLAIPIIEDMIDIREFGEGMIKINQIELITNEIILKKSTRRNKSSANYIVTNNFTVGDEALFIPVSDVEVAEYL